MVLIHNVTILEAFCEFQLFSYIKTYNFKNVKATHMYRFTHISGLNAYTTYIYNTTKICTLKNIVLPNNCYFI